MSLFLIALLPILWLVVALAGLRLAAWQACPVALALSLLASTCFFGMPWAYTATAALEGTALACWPILLIIMSTIFAYQLSVHTGGMETIRQMLLGVSSDYRVLVLLVGFGFGGFLESMAGFGTSIAIPAGMLAGMGVGPVTSVAVCLVANFVSSAYGSIGIPIVTLAGILGANAQQIATYTALQLAPLAVLCPFLMVLVAGRSLRALKGMALPCLATGVPYLTGALLVSHFVGPELAGVAGSVLSMGAIVSCASLLPLGDPAYAMPARKRERISFRRGLMAWLPFLLIFAFLLLTSKLVPSVYGALVMFQTSVLIYQGEGGIPYTFYWIATPGMIIFCAAFLAGLAQKASLADMLGVLKKTVAGQRFTVVTIITIIATAKVMGYSGMTTTIADATVGATGEAYPFIAAFIGSVGGFITGSVTSTCILLGKLQMDAAIAIGADPAAQAWMAAANASGASAGKLIAPQSIAIGVAALGAAGAGAESRLLAIGMKVYVPFVLLLGCLVYFGPALLP